MTGNRASYRQRPIASVEALGRAVGVTAAALRDLAPRADAYYYVAKRLTKPDGSIRVTHGVREPLKTVQAQILDRILRKIDFPAYLMGGIRDPDKRRGYRRNAQQHSGARLVISEDIANFFPSITVGHVTRALQHSLNLPEETAAIVARLCTLNGRVPQGASTSTYIANLVLEEHEPALVEALERGGFRYTRYIDDVHISARRQVSDQEKGQVVRAVRLLMERSGFHPKRSKHRIGTQCNRIEVHNLTVNSKPSLNRVRRKDIRAQVHALEQRLAALEIADDFHRDLDRVTGRVADLRALHPIEGERLMARLRAMRHHVRVVAAQ